MCRYTPLLLVLALGCGAARSAREVAMAKDPLEYGERCAEARVRAREAERPHDLVPPKVLQLPLLMPPYPQGARGKTIEILVLVDSAGGFDPDSVLVRGVADAAFERHTRRLLASTLEFYPARIGRCAVQGTASVTYTLGR